MKAKSRVVWVSRDKRAGKSVFIWGVKPIYESFTEWTLANASVVEQKALKGLVRPGECRAFKLVPIK